MSFLSSLEALLMFCVGQRPMATRSQTSAWWRLTMESISLPHRRLLAQLVAWQSFGERALLKNDTRFASVRVTSAELQAMCISRAVAEAALSVTQSC